jgi:hypothetical protein
MSETEISLEYVWNLENFDCRLPPNSGEFTLYERFSEIANLIYCEHMSKVRKSSTQRKVNCNGECVYVKLLKTIVGLIIGVIKMNRDKAASRWKKELLEDIDQKLKDGEDLTEFLQKLKYLPPKNEDLEFILFWTSHIILDFQDNNKNLFYAEWALAVLNETELALIVIYR